MTGSGPPKMQDFLSSDMNGSKRKTAQVKPKFRRGLRGRKATADDEPTRSCESYNVD